MIILVGIFVLCFFGQVQTQTTPVYAGCSGYMFLGENSVADCNQHITFLKVSKEVVLNFGYDYSSGRNDGFAARGFGAPDNWRPLNYMSKDQFISTMDEWIFNYTTTQCPIPEYVNYTA